MMPRVVHVHEDCKHYNDRDDRECHLDAEAEFIAWLHNGLIHDDDEQACAIVVDSDNAGVASA